jgi:hypothetical protein
MKIIQPAAILAALILLISCNQQAGKEQATETLADKVSDITQHQLNTATESETGEPGFKNGEDGQQQAQGQKKGKQQPPVTAQTINPDWDKKIIKTASVNLEVKDYNTYYTYLREKIRNMGGYVAQEEQTQSDYKIENSMTIKVPVDQFDIAVVQLTNAVQKINERKITSQDVTTEVVDTRSRMEAKKQVRQRYMDLLGQAKNMEEILNVQSRINGVQEEIESAAGRIDYLSHSSVFSTINLTYYQVLNSTAKETDVNINPSFGEKIKDAFKTGWEIVSNLFVAIITIWPLLLGSFFVFLLYKKLRVQKTKQA